MARLLHAYMNERLNSCHGMETGLGRSNQLALIEEVKLKNKGSLRATADEEI